MKRLLAVALTATALLAACGDDAMPMDNMDDDHQHDIAFTFGEPGDPAAADRVIEVVTTDTLRFDPDDLTVALGETITFRVTNNGLGVHDFTLGDQAAQDAHAAMMATMGTDMAHMTDTANAIVIEVGETKDITWTFSVAGEVLIGCHQPGHYEAGMKATIEVEG